MMRVRAVVPERPVMRPAAGLLEIAATVTVYPLLRARPAGAAIWGLCHTCPDTRVCCRGTCVAGLSVIICLSQAAGLRGPW